VREPVRGVVAGHALQAVSDDGQQDHPEVGQLPADGDSFHEHETGFGQPFLPIFCGHPERRSRGPVDGNHVLLLAGGPDDAPMSGDELLLPQTLWPQARRAKCQRARTDPFDSRGFRPATPEESRTIREVVARTDAKIARQLAGV